MRNSRWLHSLFGLVLASLICTSAHAQALGTLVPVGSAGGYTVPDGVLGSADFRYMGPGGPGMNDPVYRRPYRPSNGTLGKLGRGVLKGGLADLALMGLIAGLGWGMNEILNDLYPQNLPPYTPNPSGVYCIASTNTPGRVFCANAAAAVCPLITDFGGGWVWVLNVCQWGGYANRPPVFYPNPPPNAPPAIYPTPVAAPVSDEDLGKAIAGAPETWNGVMNDAQGRPYQTNELAAAQNALGAELASAYGLQTNPAVNPTGNPALQTNPNPLPGTATNPNGTTSNPSQSPTQLQFPLFCTWASKVCEAIDWFRESPEDDPDLDIPEVPLPTTAPAFTSVLGNGSCPASPTVNVLGTQLEFSYTPLCTFASYMYYVSLAIAALISAYIVTGKKRA